MEIKMNKRDKERMDKRANREKIKSNLFKRLNPKVKSTKESKSRVSCNLRPKLADALLLYVKRDDIPFSSRTSLIEYIVEDWAKKNNILEC